MKRIIGLILALLMLAALAACGANTEQALGGVKTLNAPAAPTEGGRSGEIRVSDDFTAKSLHVMLADLNGENRVYSPLNVYMALGMLAEITDGESRAQVLELLGSADMETLRAGIKALWEECYCDGEELKLLPAASIWLRDDASYREEPLLRLAEDHRAEAFSGPMGRESYDLALRNWINERTKHLLEQQANELSLSPETMIALVTTLYFKSSWSSPFDEDATKKDVFHAADGDTEADFMHDRLRRDYFRGERFGAISIPMQRGACMWLILPDEGVSLQELIDSGEAAAFLSGRGEWTDREECSIRLSMPKFDISSDLSLNEALQTLGVTDVFDASCADFSPLCDLRMWVSKVEHAARVMIDEEGGEAAAYTIIEMPAEAAPEIEPRVIDFVCDRPFLFAMTRWDSVLFVGAVSDPSA